jgi:hypothetical protein
MYKEKGIIAFIDEPEKIKETFSKRTFGIEVEGNQYQQPMHFDCVNSRIEQLKDVKVGDYVSVTFTIHCNSAIGGENKKLRYTSLRAGIIEKLPFAKIEDAMAPFKQEELETGKTQA